MTAAILVPAVAFVAWFIIATVRRERAEMAKLAEERRERQDRWSKLRAETQAEIVKANRVRGQFVQDTARMRKETEILRQMNAHESLRFAFGEMERRQRDRWNCEAGGDG